MGEKVRKAVELSRGFKTRVAVFTCLVVVLSLAWTAVILYYMASQELESSFFSAHRDLYNIWQELLPAVVVASAVTGLVAIIVLLLGLLRFKRSVEGAGGELMTSLEQAAEGNFMAWPGKEDSRHLQPVVDMSDKVVEALRGQIKEVKGVSEELHRAVLRLNYMAFEQEELTISELKHISANLNTLSREITKSLKWFEV